jgi:xanthine dehydrogenase accessory factor
MLAMEYREFDKVRRWHESGIPAVLVEIAGAAGSTPRETGAAMAVTTDRIAGTIGGGQLEWLAMAEARKLLGSEGQSRTMTVALGPQIGQCCGGRVELLFSRIEGKVLDRLASAAKAERTGENQVYIFGAGHTGTALAQTMAPMPFDVRLIDPRPDALMVDDSRVKKIAAAVPESVVAEARPGSAFAVMTHEHSLDFLITAEILKRGDAAYCGMIGSATKRELATRWMAENGYDAAAVTALTCPIGGSDVRDKRPQIIALLTAAEIVRALHRFHGEAIV